MRKNNLLKIKKAILRFRNKFRINGKLFIGLTTKPATSYKVVAKQHNNLYPEVSGLFLGKKVTLFSMTFPNLSGLDGTNYSTLIRHLFNDLHNILK